MRRASACWIITSFVFTALSGLTYGQEGGDRKDSQRTERSDEPGQRRNRARRGRRGGRDNSGLKVGQPAPDFNLKSLDGKSETRLSSFKTKKPVILFFGSYT